MRDVQLSRVAERHGVATAYEDWRGRRVPVSPDTIRHVLTALGVDPTDPDAAPGRGPLPPAVVVREGKAPDLVLPEGARSSVETSDGALLPFDPGLPLGVHTLRVTDQGTEHDAPLLVVPDRIDPSALRENPRLWGLMAQI
ncbi:4-alpha-glucanotransferase, partial [Streptomyces sp. NPDC000931]